MVIPEPRFCRAEAFAHLASQLTRLETSAGLLHGAIAVAQHYLPQTIADRVDSDIQRIVDTIDKRINQHQINAIVAHAHDVLFDDLGFAGNTDDYYHRNNCLLPRVLETKQGMPITLALVYKVVLDRLGATVTGVNAPGHFMTAVEMDGGQVIIDCFERGRMLTVEEANVRVGQVIGRSVTEDDAMLRPATHRQWLDRLMQNLIGLHQADQMERDLRAMLEMQQLLRLKLEPPAEL